MIPTQRGKRRRSGGRQDPAGFPKTARPSSDLSPAASIGRFFRGLRESQNLSQEQLATLTRGTPGPVSRAMISAVERGLHLPGLEVLLTLSHSLHVSPSEVLERLELLRSQAVVTDGLSYDQIDRRARGCFWAGDYRGSVGCYDALLRHLDRNPLADGDEQSMRIAAIETWRAAGLRRCGATAAARRAVERAIGLSDHAPELQAQAYIVLVALLVQLGCLPLARDAAQRAVELSEAAAPKVRGWAWIEKGEVLAASGAFADARLAFLQARRFVREAGDVQHEIKVEGNIGWCLRGLGRPGHARARYQRALALARRHAAPASEAHWLVELGRLALAADRLDEADGYSAAALALAREHGNALTAFRAEWTRHLVSRRRDPQDPDRHRVAYLRKLFVRLEDHRGVDEVGEFKQAYCRPTREGGS